MYNDSRKRVRQPKAIAKAIAAPDNRALLVAALASSFITLCISLALRVLA